MTTSQVRDILHTAPGLAESFVQHTAFSEEYDTPIKKQGGDGREKGVESYDTFRVVLKGGAKHFADITKRDLGEALNEAFDKAEIPMPAAIARAFPRKAAAR